MQITVTYDSLEEFQKYMGGTECAKIAENVQKPVENVQKPVENVQKPAETVQKPAETVAKPEPAVPAPTPAPAPAAKKITMELITEKAISLMDAGRQADLQALVSKYGVVGIPMLPEDKWEEFYHQLEVM